MRIDDLHPENPTVADYRVHLTDTHTGRVKVTTLAWGRLRASLGPHWADGHMGCDCNRARLMYGDGNHTCGEGRFRAVLHDNATGREIYRDEDP